MNSRKSNIDKNYKGNVYKTKKNLEKRKSFCPAGIETLDHA
jgi:ATP phosphoribosyltransferase regulatory subunit HisZ